MRSEQVSNPYLPRLLWCSVFLLAHGVISPALCQTVVTVSSATGAPGDSVVLDIDCDRASARAFRVSPKRIDPAAQQFAHEFASAVNLHPYRTAKRRRAIDATYRSVSGYGGMPSYRPTAPGPALYAARASVKLLPYRAWEATSGGVCAPRYGRFIVSATSRQKLLSR
jgi:hypothetical protein